MTATTIAPTIEQVAPGVTTRVKAGDLQIPQKGLLALGALALVATLAGMFLSEGESKQHAFRAYLVAYMFTLSLGLGSLFFVMVQQITRAGWSVVVRRTTENFMAVLFPWMAILFVPIALGMHELYEWTHEDVVAKDELLKGKSGYLNPTFFFVRAVVYFVVWGGLATFFRRTSLKQDQTGDAALSLKMARVAAPGLLLFALTVTAAAIDWMMSLAPHWFSTMFGLIYFGGSVMTTMAMLIVVFSWLRTKGYLGQVITQEHYHDLGKLLFAFMVFWAYTSFSQYMLIWYANLPEETEWYQHRTHGGWQPVFVTLAVGHFLLPFGMLMSRNVKRHRIGLVVGAILLIAMHWLDMQFQIMPGLHEHGMHVSWIDATALIGVLGLFLGLALKNMISAPLIPERDPRLAESLHFHNV
jgi:preprotein translocase subunit SecG